jgi:hypothetical protein
LSIIKSLKTLVGRKRDLRFLREIKRSARALSLLLDSELKDDNIKQQEK